jgi:hypothetical protein
VSLEHVAVCASCLDIGVHVFGESGHLFNVPVTTPLPLIVKALSVARSTWDE